MTSTSQAAGLNDMILQSTPALTSARTKPCVCEDPASASTRILMRPPNLKSPLAILTAGVDIPGALADGICPPLARGQRTFQLLAASWVGLVAQGAFGNRHSKDGQFLVSDRCRMLGTTDPRAPFAMDLSGSVANVSHVPVRHSAQVVNLRQLAGGRLKIGVSNPVPHSTAYQGWRRGIQIGIDLAVSVSYPTRRITRRSSTLERHRLAETSAEGGAVVNDRGAARDA